ncbi:GrpB family protein [Paenibacillus sp. F6_3S_P_1C]|uniref:GrpB family protein n=1 Tax=Paenibacillus vandeheii TaxID=3035917 RepID=A0ABT8JGB0_9BACL|nr:GrpB family protein [Paenibacillus vandeheii]MDN4604163.1 GrpB family protein [Paenibacillus vandeheii]
MKEVVVVSKYDPNWVEDYNVEREKIKRVLTNICVDLEHIGSTSVPGLGAKPLIDMMVGVRVLDDVQPVHIEALAELGYEYVPKPEFKERLFFRKGKWRAGTHHLHVYRYKSKEWNDNLLFRNALRMDPEVMLAYYALKKKLEQQFRHDRIGYTAAKAPFIQSIIQKARLQEE